MKDGRNGAALEAKGDRERGDGPNAGDGEGPHHGEGRGDRGGMFGDDSTDGGSTDGGTDSSTEGSSFDQSA